MNLWKRCLTAFFGIMWLSYGVRHIARGDMLSLRGYYIPSVMPPACEVIVGALIIIIAILPDGVYAVLFVLFFNPERVEPHKPVLHPHYHRHHHDPPQESSGESAGRPETKPTHQ